MTQLKEPATILFKMLENEALHASLLFLSITVPLLLAFVLILAGKVSDRFVKNLALTGFFAPALIACWLWGVFSALPPAHEYAFRWNMETGLEDFGISLKLGLNGISLPLYLLAGVVGLAAGLYAIQARTARLRHYLTLLLLMQGGLMGVFASIDLFFFYFFHEIALIPTFVMIGIWGGRGRRSAAMELAVYLTLGAMLSLVGLLTLYQQSGLDSFDIVSLKNHLRALPLPDGVQKYTFALLLFGFGILVSLWPFHSWAPRGYGAAPTSAVMLHAGVLKKFGLYGLIQIGAPLLPQGAHYWTGPLIWLALGNIVIIGLVTIAQRDLKQMIGYSSVMHMGYAFLGIACLSTVGVGGAIMLMFAHGLSVALLFMLSTCICHRSQTFDMCEMGGLARQAPVLAGFFVAVTLAGIGLAGFANFWGELTIFISLWKFQPWLVVPAVAGIVISTLYGLRAVARIFFGEPRPKMVETIRKLEIADLQPSERLPATILLVTLMVVGLWPQSISENVNPAVTAIYPIAEKPGAAVTAVKLNGKIASESRPTDSMPRNSKPAWTE